MPTRTLPNIAISGTPGVGKSTLCKHLATRLPSLTLLDLTTEAKSHSCRLEYDTALSCWVIDEEKLAKRLSPTLTAPGGKIIDYMHAAIWPAAAPVDLVATVRCTDTRLLWDRYKERNYKKEKIEQNVDCEIMGDIEGENREWFGWDEEGVEGSAAWAVLESGTEVQMEGNVERIVRWVEEWKKVREGLGEDEEMDVVPFAAEEVVAAEDDQEEDEEEEDDRSSDDDDDDEEEEDDRDDGKP